MEFILILGSLVLLNLGGVFAATELHARHAAEPAELPHSQVAALPAAP